ncbi:MAG TPA: hypothetical protein VL860_09605, partial [Planctomycetota bacterium]|nr:hypothetical protein [Planctomycetota bacterium]
MRRWMAALLVCLLTMAGASVAGEDAAPLAPWQVGSAEIQGEKTFLKIYVNNFGTLWSEFSRSQLYRSFAQDPAVAANSSKFIDKIDARAKAFNKAVKQDDDMYLLSQIGKIGPIIAGWEMNATPGATTPETVVDFRHTCDAVFMQQLNRYLAEIGDPQILDVFGEGFTFADKPFAHREVGGHVTVSTPYGSRFYSGKDHFLFCGPGMNEAALLKRFIQPPVANPNEADFATFMGKRDNWLAAMRFDLPLMLRNLPKDVQSHEADFKAVVGALSVLSIKEQVNKGNRFDAELTYPGADLNKGLLFFGAGTPLNNEIARIYPDELIFISHVNYDFHKLLALDPWEIPDASDEFKKGLAEMKQSACDLVTAKVEAGKPAIPGPVLTHGMSVMMLESDKLEDLGQSFVFVAGIEPGFKISEAWAGGLPMTKSWNDEKKAIKTVSYSNTDIVVIGDAGNSQTCVAVVGGALVFGQNLKQVKRVVRYLNRVAAGEVDPQKANESSHLTALTQTDGGGVLYASVLIKMDYLLKTLLPTGIGAGAMMFPDLPTNVDWAAVAGRLQPATCVLLYDPVKGFKGHMVSDLPIPSLLALGGTTGALGMMRDFNGFFFNNGQHDENDLPPPGGWPKENEEGNAEPGQ